jgi:hypothetical protein
MRLSSWLISAWNAKVSTSAICTSSLAAIGCRCSVSRAGCLSIVLPSG